MITRDAHLGVGKGESGTIAFNQLVEYEACLQREPVDRRGENERRRLSLTLMLDFEGSAA
jgi:hypothetical protein